MLYSYRYLSPLGEMTLTCNEQALTGLWFDGQRSMPTSLPDPNGVKSSPIYMQTKEWLDTYFGGLIPSVLPPLAPVGTLFQLDVWNLLLEIPYGQTVSYKDLAQELVRRKYRKTMAAQAVGQAVGHNPISILIPCHRVIGSNGNLTGYAGGLTRKKKLLAIEQVDRINLFIPRK